MQIANRTQPGDNYVFFIWGKTCCFKNQSFRNLAYFILYLGLFDRKLAYFLKRQVLKQQVFPRIKYQQYQLRYQQYQHLYHIAAIRC